MRQGLKHRSAGLGLLALGVAVSLAGCATSAKHQNYTESLTRSGITTSEDAPAWVTGEQVQRDDARVYFVGRGTGRNTLDERGAYNAARQHVVHQIAQLVHTSVKRHTEAEDTSYGVRYLGEQRGSEAGTGLFSSRTMKREQLYQQLTTSEQHTVEAIVGGMVEEATYFEAWKIQEDPQITAERERPARRIKRYKCWVLMSIDRDQLRRRIQDNLGRMRAKLAAHIAEIEAESAARRTRIRAKAEAFRIRTVGEAEARARLRKGIAEATVQRAQRVAEAGAKTYEVTSE